MQRVPYKSIDLKSPMRVFRGRGKVTSVEAVPTVAKITRIFDGPLDFYLVEGPNVVDGVEIEAHNVCGGVRETVATRGKGGHRKKGDAEDEVGDE